ncbi:MAG: helix-turn-helix domain-containing protein [Solirubrobacterales bacterium]|nr:helix-turn-helix domain-containing protein [Solirubrobacterales bacterium]
MADIGSTLREARMRTRIDITEVEAQTKIRAKYLRAMENEEWDLLPGPVYVKSFLRTYGDFLGLDSRLLVDEFKRRYEGVSDHDLPPVAAVGRERERAARGPLLPPWAIVGAVLVVVVVALYLLGSGNKTKTPSPTGLHGNTHKRKHPRRPAPTPAPPPQTVNLQLKPTGRVYVCLVNGAGKQLIPGQIFTGGQTIPPQTAGKLLVTFGNDSVQMTVNGRPVNIPASSNSIGYELLPGSTRQIPPPQQPTCR